MSYAIAKFEQGEVAIRGDVYGWFFESTNDFRPLNKDLMEELYVAGYATTANCVATERAKEQYTTEVLEQYIRAQANRTAEQIAEQRAEARAAFGAGEEVVNIITGERYIT